MGRSGGGWRGSQIAHAKWAFGCSLPSTRSDCSRLARALHRYPRFGKKSPPNRGGSTGPEQKDPGGAEARALVSAMVPTSAGQEKAYQA